MNINHLDHLVLTVRSIPETIAFYTRVLGMEAITYDNGRQALNFGVQKINLHEVDNQFTLKASNPQPGSADLCFVASTPLAAVMDHLNAQQVAIVRGPIARTGANGRLRSIYINDPDGNLIEISNYVD